MALVNQVRARVATRPSGTITYAPAGCRVEFGEESLRLRNLVRTGRYVGSPPADVRARAMSHIPTEASVNPSPRLPIPLSDAQAWKLTQNSG